MPQCAPDDLHPVVTNGHGDEASAPLRDACRKVAAQVNAFLALESDNALVKKTQEQTRVALGVVTVALEKYGLDALSISYNGGKDCLVLLLLYLCALATYSDPLPATLESVYIISKHPFAEVDQFVNDSARDYKLDLTRYAMPMKQAFEQYLKDKPQVKGIFVGTRRTDPHGQFLTHFDMTDKGWPSFMRIHPVIDWHYAEIWTFIRQAQIPYCKLYDMGYTSLGGTTDTHPNPALKASQEEVKGGGETLGFKPAYELIEDEAERLGRD